MARLRPLTEEECYARCYGMRSDDVTVIRVERPRAAHRARVHGEVLRRRFEELLEARPPDVPVEPFYADDAEAA